MRTRSLTTAAGCSMVLLLAACSSSVQASADASTPTATTSVRTAAAASGPIVSTYQMNEGSGATVMRDSTADGPNGRLGSDVTSGVSSQGAVGYRFPSVDPNSSSTHPGHLVTIPDSADIDPGTSTYSVEIRYKTTEADGANLIQKGQARSAGGQFKIQVPEGNPQCIFKGPSGNVGATSPTKINDGNWHTLRCTRNAQGVSLYVDGVLRKHHDGSVGNIDNSFPMTIAGKPNCNMVKVQCDYFGGMIDYVKITKG